MPGEKLSVEQAMQRLSDATTDQITRMSDLERKLETDITTFQNNMMERISTIQTQTQTWQANATSTLNAHQQQFSDLMEGFRDMKLELQKIVASMTTNVVTDHKNQLNNEHTSDPIMHPNAWTPNRNFNTATSLPSMKLQDLTTEHRESPYISPMIQPVSTIHTVVIPPTSALPLFHGRHDENPRQFLIRIQEYAQTIHQSNDNGLLNSISQYLRDTALEWYCQIRITPHRPTSWHEFTALFLAQFNSPIRRARKEQEWRECKQRENETINEFLVRLRTLWTEQKPSETETDLIKHLMCKMRNDLLTMIGVSNYESLDELIIEAQKVEEILYRRAKQFRQSNNSQPTSNYTKAYDEDQYELQEMSAHHSNRSGTIYNHTTNRQTNYPNNSTPYRYSNYTSNSTRNQRPTSEYESQCNMCGLMGHSAKNCRHQYYTRKQTQNDYYQKNADGANRERDHVAPQ